MCVYIYIYIYIYVAEKCFGRKSYIAVEAAFQQLNLALSYKKTITRYKIHSHGTSLKTLEGKGLLVLKRTLN